MVSCGLLTSRELAPLRALPGEAESYREGPRTLRREAANRLFRVEPATESCLAAPPMACLARGYTVGSNFVRRRVSQSPPVAA